MSQPIREQVLGELYEECKNKVCDNLFKRYNLRDKIEFLKSAWSETEIEDLAREEMIKNIKKTDYDDLSPADKIKVDNMIEAEKDEINDEYDNPVSDEEIDEARTIVGLSTSSKIL